MKKVSIVLPVYNGEKYIKEALDGIRAQTYSNWELILVNDCSTDATKKIVDQYAAMDKRITVIHNKTNQKLPRSLNIGFSAADGAYFTWTSDDNIYEKDAIEQMVRCLDEHPQYGMVYCDMCYIDEEGKITGDISMDEKELYVRNCIGACFLYRQKAAKEAGEYDPNMFLVEDYEYWLRLNEHVTIYHLAEKKYYYRKHQGSLTEKRAAEIRNQLYVLRKRKLNFLLERLDREGKIQLFLEMWLVGPEEMWNTKDSFFGEEVPEIIHWLVCIRKHNVDETKKYILIGAGEIGRRTFGRLGKENIAYFADNNPSLKGQTVEGKPVIGVDDLSEIYQDYNVVIAVDISKSITIARQLKEKSIDRFCLLDE